MSEEGDARSNGGLGGDQEQMEGDELDVEVEHLSDDNQLLSSSSPAPPLSGRHVVKRTFISSLQRAILEEYFRMGMNSASMQLHHLHAAAVEKTGLELSVVKNWVRNRRRPTAAQMVERIAAQHAAAASAPPPSASPSSSSSSSSSSSGGPGGGGGGGVGGGGVIAGGCISLATTSLPCSLPLTVGGPHTHTLPYHQQHPSHPHLQHQHQHHGHLNTSSSSPSSTSSPSLHVISSSSSVPTGAAIVRPSPSNVHLSGTPEPKKLKLEAVQPCPLLVKARVAESGERDFVEVELESLTYQALLSACCEELEVRAHEVHKIRKLPNVWVRKDKDVQRLRDEQELELVLKHSLSVPITSVLTVNPFASTNGLSILGVEPMNLSSSKLDQNSLTEVTH